MSSIFYKFKAAKDFDTCKFDGAGISCFDAKKEIMVAKRLGKGTDFDLVLYNSQTNEEYEDDNFVIPKNTSVFVSRRPAAKAGKGNAQKYLGVNTHATTASFNPRPNAPMRLNNQSAVYTAPQKIHENMTEDEKIKAMFSQQAHHWETTQDQMTTQRPVYRPMAPNQSKPTIVKGGMQNMMTDLNEREPHPGYICFRCGEKGHFINMCPTLGNKDYDNRPKLKKTTGIPKMFLKSVENRDGSGLMVTTTGEFVVAQPNDEAWLKVAARVKPTDTVYDDIPEELRCSIDDKLFSDAVSTSCCGTNFCQECISYSILENADISIRNKCPFCRKRLTLEMLSPNYRLRDEVVDFIRSSRNKKESNLKMVNSTKPEAIPEKDIIRHVDRSRVANIPGYDDTHKSASNTSGYRNESDYAFKRKNEFEANRGGKRQFQ